MKCIVHGCENRRGEGHFKGDMCFPCFGMLTTGRVGHGTNFIVKLQKELDEIKQRMEGLEK